jgi:ATP-dependent protease ClpP protease subunit
MVDLPNLLESISIPIGPQMSLGKSSGPSGNHVFFYDEVGPENIATLIQELRETKTNIRRTFSEWEDVVPPPIHLHIHSDGGDLLSGIAGGETIRTLGLPVHTHIEGSAASAATVLSLAGTHRTITQKSFILIHQISSDFWGKYDEMEDHKENMDRFMKMMMDMYVDRTKLPKARLKEMLKRDLWFTSAEALEYGLVDEVL